MTVRMPSSVEFKDVRKSFGNKEVLSACSFDVAAGKLTAVVGPSGCGKSTIIDLVAGYIAPDAGSVLLDGSLIQGPASDRLVVFQETALFPWKSTLKNVMFGSINHRADRAQAEREAIALLAKLGLAGFEAKYPRQLSGGMQRRAELARALINNPKVMLLDEPFRGLDAMTRELMQEYLLKVFEANPVTTVFVTSEIEEAIFLADRIALLTIPPTRVKKMVEVDLPRPRRIQMLSSARFGEIQAVVLEGLLEEARKGFSSGMADAAELLEAYGQATRERAGR